MQSKAQRGAARAVAPNEERGKRDRRAALVTALRECILRKGYAGTSVTELARAADMSVSHFLYYYPNKEAVLLDLARQVHERVLTSVGAHRHEPPEERIHLLVDNLLVAVPREELGLLREFIAVASHSPAIHANLSEYAQASAAFLEDLFEQTPRQPGMTAADAAETAGALWMGLMINAAFETRLDNNGARRIFRKALLSLANLGGDALAPEQESGRKKTTPRKSRRVEL
jgi:AcrR family transcriptional regulator